MDAVCICLYIHRVWALDLLPLAHTNYLYHQWLAHGHSQYTCASRLASPSRAFYYRQVTCYYYRQLTSYSQVEGIGGRTTFASGELKQRLVQAHAHRAGLA
jgi:hypothetical protein